jgi:hypothetical protein
MEKIRKTLADSKTARWTALAVVAFTMLCGYFLTDAAAPLKTMLEQRCHGAARNMVSLPVHMAGSTCFLDNAYPRGIILDKSGVRFTGKMATY